MKTLQDQKMSEENVDISISKEEQKKQLGNI